MICGHVSLSKNYKSIAPFLGQNKIFLLKKNSLNKDHHKVEALVKVYIKCSYDSNKRSIKE